METTTKRPAGTLSNLVAILTSILLIGFSIWGGSAYGSGQTGESPAPHIPSITHFLAGALGLAGVMVAQRWGRIVGGRLLLITAAAILMATVALFQYVGSWAWISLIIPAVLLAGCAMFIRPVPAPPEPPPPHPNDLRPT